MKTTMLQMMEVGKTAIRKAVLPDKQVLKTLVMTDKAFEAAYGRGTQGDRKAFDAYVGSVSQDAIEAEQEAIAFRNKLQINLTNLAVGEKILGVRKAANEIGSIVGDVVSDVIVAAMGRDSRRLKAVLAARRATKIWFSTIKNQAREFWDAETVLTVDGEEVSL